MLDLVGVPITVLSQLGSIGCLAGFPLPPPGQLNPSTAQFFCLLIVITCDLTLPLPHTVVKFFQKYTGNFSTSLINSLQLSHHGFQKPFKYDPNLHSYPWPCCFLACGCAFAKILFAPGCISCLHISTVMLISVLNP
jgi:hypothetical protein